MQGSRALKGACFALVSETCEQAKMSESSKSTTFEDVTYKWMVLRRFVVASLPASICGLVIWLNPTLIWGQHPSPTCAISATADGVRIDAANGVVHLQVIESNILRVDVKPNGEASPRTLVMDPHLSSTGRTHVAVSVDGESAQIGSSQLRVSTTCSPELTISVSDPSGRRLIQQADALGDAHGHRAVFLHAADENLYGMSGLSRRENGGSLERNHGSEVSAGAQGEGGAPWFFTTHYGVLIDSDGGTFDTRDGWIEFSGDSRKDFEYFVIAGDPMQSISGLSKLTGLPPLPPKWTIGFLNSQWGATESEIKEIATTYRTKHIPIDAFILDFDWKAWGEDNYGEWRWNSTSSPENFSPDKFPDGASGAFATEMRSQGIRLAGILKPRILLYTKGSTTELHEASAYAEAHSLWYPDEPPVVDYFTQRPARDLDFSQAKTRSWYWGHLEPAFDAGMVAWWNDEADVTASAQGQDFHFDNFQFLNMGRMLYEGQRGHSTQRVWSLNRNYYLGAQRYGYAEWSGDIQTGFQTMEHQRARMLATLDLGEPHWSMDTGGFFGHPTAENYTRWLEFAAFVPIDRVHGDLTERRQPWLYGSVAESAVTKAIRLRYQLLPYIYSYERVATETGVGIVRPLFWAFPDDPKLANESSSWMFGDALLVSPVVVQGEAVHHFYLPAGVWHDYFRGTKITGGRIIDYSVDPQTWSDIPLFVRDGSIVASQPPEDYVDQHASPEVTLDIFPATNTTQFVYYDDDGETYAYERGVYYNQAIRASKEKESVRLDFDRPSGSLRGRVLFYVVRVHGVAAKTVMLNQKGLSKALLEQTKIAPEENCWTTGRDQFGPVTTLKIRADLASGIVLR